MFILRVLMLLIFPAIFSCAGGHSSPWKAYVFDGSTFAPAQDTLSTALWVRSGHVPATVAPTSKTAASDRLPPGTGAVAGICYIHTSGGKIAAHTAFTPCPDEQITFKNKKEGVSVTRTDKDGYFIEHLPAGEYELFCRGVRAEFRITHGETTLVPVRGGKRMAD